MQVAKLVLASYLVIANLNGILYWIWYNNFFFPGCLAQEEEDVPAPTVEDDLGEHQEGSRTDSQAVER